MMRIPIELAETIAVVVDEGTLDAAAQRLRITPSAVSQRLKTLERQVGRVLLVRSKPVRATEAGQAIVRLARQIALLERDAVAELDLAPGSRERAVTIPLAVNADSLATWFLEPLARISARHRIVFDVHRDDQDFTAGLLESGTVMAAVTSQSTPVPGCRVSPLGVLEYEACATPAFAAQWFAAGADMASLAQAPFVDFDRRDDLQASWLRAHGVLDAPARHYVPASHDYALAVRLGLGWGMLPTIQSAADLADGHLVRLDGPRIPVALYWQQWNLTSPLLDEIAAEVARDAGRSLSRR